MTVSDRTTLIRPPTFILKQNGYPAGSKEPVYEETEKPSVPLKYYGN
jgi:hypothetical protein